MATSNLPTIVKSIDQRYLIEPLGGPQEVTSYLDRFPDTVYDKSLDSHLVKFMYSMLGPAGIGHIRRNFLEARLLFEAHGLELNNLDRFYGNPFQFGRISDEVYSEDTLGLLPQGKWEEIRSKDSRYRNRIIDFMSGARAGNTPFGMRLVARSGLGHEAEIVENYKHFYDANSDDKLGIPRLGKTTLLCEMVIVPRQEVSRAEVQKITLLGRPDGGSFQLALLDEFTTPISYNASRQSVQSAIENLGAVGERNVEAQGGPLDVAPITIRFVGTLAAKNLNQLRSNSSLLGGTNPQIVLTTTVQGFDAANEPLSIDPRDQYYLQEAIDRIRPLTVIPTFAEGAGTKSRSNWVRSSASSEFDEMLRYVTGSGSISWPPTDSVRWIEAGIEHQALRAHNSLSYQYSNFHDVTLVNSYNELGVSRPEYLAAEWHAIKNNYVSNHVGSYVPEHSRMFSILNSNNDAQADYAMADYTDPLTVDRVIETPSGPISLINGIYPAEYQSLPDAPQVRYRFDQFWSSPERVSGDEYLEIDFGVARAVNFLSLELTRKPISITIQYDSLDLDGPREWHPVYQQGTHTELSRDLYFDGSISPWLPNELAFTNPRGEMIYTRYMRIKFTRRADGFLVINGTQYPWSVDVRNLRIGRNVSN